MSDVDRYCSEICGGKCCYNGAWSRCKHLTDDNKCGIYHLWKDNWCHYDDGRLKAMPIKELIEKKLLHPMILDQCVYAHPELVEKVWQLDANKQES